MITVDGVDIVDIKADYPETLKKQLARFNDIQKKTKNAPKARSPEWYLGRYNGWGSSDVDAALGCNYLRKSGEAILEKGLCLDSTPNEVMLGGIKGEPAVRTYLEKKYGVRVYETANVESLRPYLRDSSDGQYIDFSGLLPKPVVVEIKCAQKRKITGTIPKYYRNQIQNHLFATGFDSCLYAEVKITDNFINAKDGMCGTYEPLAVFDKVPQTKPDGFWCIEEIHDEFVAPDPEWGKVADELGESWKRAMVIRELLKKELGEKVRVIVPEFKEESDDDIFELIRLAKFKPEKIAKLMGLNLETVKSCVDAFTTTALEIQDRMLYTNTAFLSEGAAREQSYLMSHMML